VIPEAVSKAGPTPAPYLGPMFYVSALLVLGAACYTVGYLRFRSRDLPAPQ